MASLAPPLQTSAMSGQEAPEQVCEAAMNAVQVQHAAPPPPPAAGLGPAGGIIVPFVSSCHDVQVALTSSTNALNKTVELRRMVSK
jgi:hypothetical protein